MEIFILDVLQILKIQKRFVEMVKEKSNTLMDVFILVSGKMISRMEKAFLLILMD
jgi:hypothetical protein